MSDQTIGKIELGGQSQGSMIQALKELLKELQESNVKYLQEIARLNDRIEFLENENYLLTHIVDDTTEEDDE